MWTKTCIYGCKPLNIWYHLLLRLLLVPWKWIQAETRAIFLNLERNRSLGNCYFNCFEIKHLYYKRENAYNFWEDHSFNDDFQRFLVAESFIQMQPKNKGLSSMNKTDHSAVIPWRISSHNRKWTFGIRWPLPLLSGPGYQEIWVYSRIFPGTWVKMAPVLKYWNYLRQMAAE